MRRMRLAALAALAVLSACASGPPEKSPAIKAASADTAKLATPPTNVAGPPTAAELAAPERPPAAAAARTAESFSRSEAEGAVERARHGFMPAAPPEAVARIDLVVRINGAPLVSDTVLWRSEDGVWSWWRAANFGAGPSDPPPNPNVGKLAAARAVDLDRRLDDPARRSEPPVSPASGRSPDGSIFTCHDGQDYRLEIHRRAAPDEAVAQSCTTRGLNGELIRLILSEAH